MSLLNQAAVDALCSATYLETYLDCAENLPNELQRYITQLRDLDFQTNEIVNELTRHEEGLRRHEDPGQRKLAIASLQRSLIKKKDVGDQKLDLLAKILEVIENKGRQLEIDFENLDPGTSVLGTLKDDEPPVLHSQTKPIVETPSSSGTSLSKVSKTTEDKSESSKGKRHRRTRTAQDGPPVVPEEEKKFVVPEEEEKPRKKKPRRERATNDKSPSNNKVVSNIDPNEPVYCICREVSYGEMIGCDNEKCKIEWYHFNCLGLTHKPKGKWYCPNCRGDRPNILNPDLADQIRKGKKSNAD